MALKTSLIITGETLGAVKALDDATAAVDRLDKATAKAGGAQTQAASGARTLAAETDKLTAAGRQAESAIADQAKAATTAGGAQAQAASAARALATEVDKVTAAGTGASGALATVATAGNPGAIAQQAAGYDSLAKSVQAMAQSVAAGVDPLIAVEQHGTAMYESLQKIGGASTDVTGAIGATGEAAAAAGEKLGGLAEEAAGGTEGVQGLTGGAAAAAGMLGGVLGTVIGEVVGLLGGLIIEAYQADKAMLAIELGASAVATAQDVMGEMFDLTTGKLEKNTEALRLNAQAQALNLLASASARRAKANAAIAGTGAPGVGNTLIGMGQIAAGAGRDPEMTAEGMQRFRGGTDAVRQLADDYRRLGSIKDPNARATAKMRLMQRAAGTDFKGSSTSQNEFIQAIRDDALADEERDTAFGIQRTLDSGVLDRGLRRDGKPKKKPKPKSTAARDEFGRDAGARLAAIRDNFDDTAPAVKKVNGALREIDDLVDDLNRKKPVGFAAMVAQAEALRDIVGRGLTEPLREFVEEQRQAYAVGEALLAGDTARAEQLKIIAQLERQMGPLTAAQKEEVLATVQALDAQARQLDILRDKQQIYLGALGQVKGIVEDATQAFVRGDLGQFIRTPGKLLDAFQSLQGQLLFDKLFDGAFRELQDQVTGTKIVEGAAIEMASAVGTVTGATLRTATALDRVAAAAERAAGAVDGVADGGAVIGGAGGPAPVEAPPRDVVVTARRTPEAVFGGAIGKIAEKLGGFAGVKDPEKFGKEVGKYAGKGLAGAATGALVSGVAGSLGIKLNKTGSQIGGAIGNLTGIPGGAVIGSILGGLAGNLLGKKKTDGSAGVTVANGQFAAGAGTGANAALAKQAKGLAGGVASALAQIAGQLGGGVGNTSGVTIGVNNGNYHVNSVGGQIGKKGSGDQNFDDDADAAVAYAVGALVGKGAITGVSAAVAKAIQSSPDVNAALGEALKVRDLELIMGGIGATLGRAVQEFESQAKERLRIAGQYGFDVIAIEKRNAEDRLKLGEQLLRSQVGSLQTLVEEITRGSLFEGSALDRLALLNEAIGKARTDLDAGIDGAADNLSSLLQQRLSVSKETFATTGGYAADRTDTLDQARAAIATANARIVAAQAGTAKSDPALATTNAALDENNDQNAEMLAALKTNNELVAQLLARQATTGPNDFTQLARY